MFDILTQIVDVISTLFTFLINSITSLIALIVNIPNYVSLLISSVNVLPSFIIPFSLAYISIIVVQYILNRRVG